VKQNAPQINIYTAKSSVMSFLNKSMNNFYLLKIFKVKLLTWNCAEKNPDLTCRSTDSWMQSTSICREMQTPFSCLNDACRHNLLPDSNTGCRCKGIQIVMQSFMLKIEMQALLEENWTELLWFHMQEHAKLLASCSRVEV
jgi:hypothetical protein